MIDETTAVFNLEYLQNSRFTRLFNDRGDFDAKV